MYFISRNNALYSYIAHTSPMRRYAATLFFIGTIVLIGFYAIYAPFRAHIVMNISERARLQKQSEEIDRVRDNNRELLIAVDTSKKNIKDLAVLDDNKEQECTKRMQFLFDTVAQLGLQLNSYASCGVKDKKWYTKDRAHLKMSGSFEKLVSFFKAIKDSENMITLSHVVITRVKDNLFQLSCDVGIITVKS